jgi:hypothetical protein
VKPSNIGIALVSALSAIAARDLSTTIARRDSGNTAGSAAAFDRQQKTSGNT